MPVAGHVGSDYPKLRPEFRIVTNPFDANQRVLVVPAIRPDVAIIHAIVAAPDGTCLLDHMSHAPRARVMILNHPDYLPFRNGSKEFYDFAQRGDFDLFFLSGGQI